MKIITILIILLANFSYVNGQIDSFSFENDDNTFDSTYIYHWQHTYILLSFDTLKFDDGERVFQVIEKTTYRNDTSVQISSALLEYKADTNVVTLAYPSYTKVTQKLRFQMTDTIREADDPFNYWVETSDSLDFWIANTYILSSKSYFGIIQKIYQKAKKQHLNIIYQSTSFYGDSVISKNKSTINDINFENIDFVHVYFIFEKDGITMDYQIIFKNKNGG